MCNPIFDFDNDGEISLEEEMIGTGLVLDLLDDEADEDNEEN